MHLATSFIVNIMDTTLRKIAVPKDWSEEETRKPTEAGYHATRTGNCPREIPSLAEQFAEKAVIIKSPSSSSIQTAHISS